MSLLRQNRRFLDSILREANAKRRQVMLDHANKKQINALSEMILNLLKKRIPIEPGTYRKLKRHKNVLRTLANRQTSLKRRREQLKEQKGGSFWSGLNECYKVCR